MKREEIREHYRERREEIYSRLEEFESLRQASEERIFKELVFVILTSQTRADKAWEAVENLDRKNLLLKGSEEEIAKELRDFEIQYEENKASYIVENREKLSQPTLQNPEKELKLEQKLNFNELEKTREWLVDNIKGLGWKGASHFLRNIGYGNSFAIVSSYIAKALNRLELKESPNQPRNRQEYIETEEKMQQLADELGIDIKALDLVLWSMETGEVFK